MLLLHYLHQLRKKNIAAFSIFFDDNSREDLKKITDKYNIDLVYEKFSEEDFWEWIFLLLRKSTNQSQIMQSYPPLNLLP